VVALVVALFALNYWVGSMATRPAARVRVPYSPFFLNEVSAGRVASITSKGTAIQGTFEHKESYAGSTASLRFRTEIPSFADTKALSQLLQRKRVVVNAQPLTTSAPWWESLLVGFGPTILFVGLLFWLMRRAGNVQGMLGAFGRSRARRYEPSGVKVTFAERQQLAAFGAKRLRLPARGEVGHRPGGVGPEVLPACRPRWLCEHARGLGAPLVLVEIAGA